MRTHGLRTTAYAALSVLLALVSLMPIALVAPAKGAADPRQESRTRAEAALANIINLDRPGEDGLATIWDGNKYVQCRRTTDRDLRCEAAGTVMQPSLAHVLVPERLARLAALGWQLDPSFGNYVQDFSADLPLENFDDATIAGELLTIFYDVYGYDGVPKLAIATEKGGK